MYTGIVTIKGQVVIPSPLRSRHHIKKGTRICFVEQGDDIVIKPVTDDYIDKMRGSLKSHGSALKELLVEKERERKL